MSQSRSASSPKVFGFCQSSPLSIVTSAIGPTRVKTFWSLNSVGALATVLQVLPEDRRAHAHADAERGEPVARSGPVAKSAGELRHEANAGRRERMPAGDGTSVRVQTRVVGRHADAVAPGQDLDGERLVELEETDVVDREPGAARDRLTGGMYVPKGESDITGVLEAAFTATVACEPIDEKLRKAVKKGKIIPRAGADVGALARDHGLITAEEYTQWARKEALRKQVIKADDFPQDYGRAEAVASLESATVKMKAA